MGRALVILSGVLILAILAGGLTEATLAIGHRGRLVDDTSVRPATPRPIASASATPSPSSTPIPPPTPTVTPASTPTPTPAVRTATTNSFVHLRAGKSIYTAILTDLNGGTTVVLLPDSDAQWQQVQYNGLTGYIFKAYLTY